MLAEFFGGVFDGVTIETEDAPPDRVTGTSFFTDGGHAHTEYTIDEAVSTPNHRVYTVAREVPCNPAEQAGPRHAKPYNAFDLKEVYGAVMDGSSHGKHRAPR